MRNNNYLSVRRQIDMPGEIRGSETKNRTDYSYSYQVNIEKNDRIDRYWLQPDDTIPIARSEKKLWEIIEKLLTYFSSKYQEAGLLQMQNDYHFDRYEHDSDFRTREQSGIDRGESRERMDKIDGFGETRDA